LSIKVTNNTIDPYVIMGYCQGYHIDEISENYLVNSPMSSENSYYMRARGTINLTKETREKESNGVVNSPSLEGEESSSLENEEE